MQWLDAPADKYNMCVSAPPQSLFAKDFVKDYTIVKRHYSSSDLISRRRRRLGRMHISMGGEQLLRVQRERGKGEADTWPKFILQCGGRYKTRLCYNAIYY